MPDVPKIYGYVEGGVFKILSIPDGSGGIRIAASSACCCACEDIHVIRMEYHLFSNCCCGPADSLPDHIVATCMADDSVSVQMDETDMGHQLCPATFPSVTTACVVDQFDFKTYVAYLCVPDSDYAGLFLPGHNGPTFSVSVPGHELMQGSWVIEVSSYVNDYTRRRFNEKFCNCHSYRESGSEYEYTEYGFGNGIVEPCDSRYRILVSATVVVPPCAESCPVEFESDAVSVGANDVPDGAITVHVSGDVGSSPPECMCQNGYTISCEGVAFVDPDLYNEIAGDPDRTGMTPISFRIPDISSPGSYITFQVSPVTPRPECEGQSVEPTHTGSVTMSVPEGDMIRHVFRLEIRSSWMYLERDLTETEYRNQCWFPDSVTASGAFDDPDDPDEACATLPPAVTLRKETWAEASARQNGNVRNILYSGCAEIVTACEVGGHYEVDGLPPGHASVLSFSEIVGLGDDCSPYIVTDSCSVSPCDDSNDSNDGYDSNDSNDGYDSNDIPVVGHCASVDWYAIPSVTYAFATNTCDSSVERMLGPSIDVAEVPDDIIYPIGLDVVYRVPGETDGYHALHLCVDGFLYSDEIDRPLWLRPPPECGEALAGEPDLDMYSCDGSGQKDMEAELRCPKIDLLTCGEGLAFGAVYVYGTTCPVPVTLFVELGSSSCGCCDVPSNLSVRVESKYQDGQVVLALDPDTGDYFGDVLACADDLDGDGEFKITLPDGLECYGNSGTAYARVDGSSLVAEFPCSCDGSEFGLQLDSDGCPGESGQTLSVAVVCGQATLATVSADMSDLDFMSFFPVMVPSVCHGCDGEAVPSLLATVLDSNGNPVADVEAKARWHWGPFTDSCGMSGDIVVMVSKVRLSTVNIEVEPWDQQAARDIDAVGGLPPFISIDVSAEYPRYPEWNRTVTVVLAKSPQMLSYSGSATIQVHCDDTGRVTVPDQTVGHLRIGQSADSFGDCCASAGISFNIDTDYSYQQ